MFKQKTLTLALASLLTTPAWATADDALMQEVRRLAERVAQLEAALDKTAGGPEGDRMAELSDRVEDMENQVLVLKKPGKVEQALEGISVGGALTMVGQRATSGAASGVEKGQLSYRADLEVDVPGDTLGRLAGFGDSRFFVHLRAGQGAGLEPGHEIGPTLSATPNSTAFYLTNAEDASPILAQAWYQLGTSLSPRASGALPRVEATLGKIDLFGFFDQNDVADDESEGFMNNAFVHNPLLDSGGDIGADSYGFAPGLILGYTSDVNSVNRWKLSLGLFGTGAGAGFQTSFSKPLAIAQAEYGGRVLRDRPGNYRLYAWTNGRATPYANEFDTTEERHSGWGLSVDQEVARHLNLFARYGQSTAGRVKIERALTLGGQLGGYAWGRQNDRVGLAFAWLDPSAAFKAAAPGVDADADGNPDFGFSPDGAERTLELFYAWQVNDTFQLTPSWQWIGRPGGDAGARDVSILGLRAKAAF
ncbi:MAG: carbohydrate porin [Pseudomonadota bacterium]